MSAARALSASDKREIALIYKSNPKLTAKEVLKELRKRLGTSDWPKLSVIQRELKKIRDIAAQIEAEQLAAGWWDLGTYVNHPDINIPADAIPRILEIIDIITTEIPDIKDKPLSVKTAQWIGRLYTLIDDPIDLHLTAFFYAQMEVACKMANVPLFTADLDREIYKGNFSLIYLMAKGSKLEKLLKVEVKK